MTLARMIADPATTIDEIAGHLDRLDADERWREVGVLDRDAQRTLFEKAYAQAIGLDHFVNGHGPREEVIHDGLNTLPVPPPLRRFQKRFCRPARDGERLYGYNEGVTRRVIGPGYFVVVATRGRPSWEARGPVVIDYFVVPDGEVPGTWPPIVSNARGLQRFVYHQTRDFMRRVSQHVSVGAAFKRERPLDHYFVLCRRA